MNLWEERLVPHRHLSALYRIPVGGQPGVARVSLSESRFVFPWTNNQNVRPLSCITLFKGTTANGCRGLAEDLQLRYGVLSRCADAGASRNGKGEACHCCEEWDTASVRLFGRSSPRLSSRAVSRREPVRCSARVVNCCGFPSGFTTGRRLSQLSLPVGTDRIE
jgi:hypothetical protein